MNRRQFLHNSAALPAGVRAAPVALPAILSGQSSSGRVSLREKFFGCIVGCHVGSAMGVVVETWPYERIEQKYGTLNELVPYGNKARWLRPAGTTEDGVERQKLMITAIIEKKDRVTAEDVKRFWVRDIKPEGIGLISEPFEGPLLAMAKSGIPASDIGRYCDYAGLVSFARACHPIGLINAGDIEGAAADVFEVGQLYQTANSRGLQWAAITAIAIAAATKPGATVDSVVGAILAGDPRFTKNADQIRVVREIERGLKLTQGCQDFREMRSAFDKVYSGTGMQYAYSYANEIVTKGVCVFRMAKGNTKEAIIAGSNMGRDTDCLAAVAGGIAGALTGASSVPEQWIKQVDEATSVNKFTNSQRTLRESSDGLYQAWQARLSRLKAYLDAMAAE